LGSQHIVGIWNLTPPSIIPTLHIHEHAPDHVGSEVRRVPILSQAATTV